MTSRKLRRLVAVTPNGYIFKPMVAIIPVKFDRNFWYSSPFKMRNNNNAAKKEITSESIRNGCKLMVEKTIGKRLGPALPFRQTRQPSRRAQNFELSFIHTLLNYKN